MTPPGVTRRPAFARDGRLVAPSGAEIPEILGSDGATVRDRLRRRDVSSAELAGACLDRIEALNPACNAVVSLRPRSEILAEARRADEALARGEEVGALHGLPIAIKDLSATRGLRTTYGSPLFADHVPEADDLSVARIRAAGAIIVGKTNTPELGLGSHTYNPVHGATRNAFDPTRSAGGSSGGAAVALALGLLPIADGSDMGGSLRNPGAYNNVFGLRPSQGLVPAMPSHDPFYAQLATIGPMGRSAADLAMLLGVLAGHDPRAPLSLDAPPWRDEPVRAAAHAPRIAWLGDLGGHLAVEPGILDLCSAALADLEGAGWSIEPAVPAFDWERLWQAFVVLRQFSLFGRWADTYADPAKRASMKPEMRWEIAGGATLDIGALARAMEVRGAWYAAILPLFERYDALALPTAQVFPFPVEWAWPREIAGREMDSYHRWMEVVVPGTMSGCPVVNVPAGFDAAGRPMGLQLVGVPRGDHALLALAARFAQDAAREA